LFFFKVATEKVVNNCYQSRMNVIVLFLVKECFVHFIHNKVLIVEEKIVHEELEFVNRSVLE